MQERPFQLTYSKRTIAWAAVRTLCPFIVWLAPSTVYSEPLILGGSTPSQRPEEAPAIERFAGASDVLETGLRGVSKPYPSSLMFLKDQGAWYTPFLRPGMSHPYDLRNLRSSDSNAAIKGAESTAHEESDHASD